MKFILVIPAVALLFFGLLGTNKTLPLRASVSSLVTENALPESTNKMWADKSILYKGNSFQLYFEMPHSQYLGVVDPQGHFFYVVYPVESSEGNLTPLVSSQYFNLLSALTIQTSTFNADPYTYGVLENQPVFTQSGIYRFVLGDNLHIDDTDHLSVVEIQYTHAAPPLICKL